MGNRSPRTLMLTLLLVPVLFACALGSSATTAPTPTAAGRGEGTSTPLESTPTLTRAPGSASTPTPYTLDQAVGACAAYTALHSDSGPCMAEVVRVGASVEQVVVASRPEECVVWSYAGSAAGHVKSAATCTRPTSTDPLWA
jgi:hypothetical protein